MIEKIIYPLLRAFYNTSLPGHIATVKQNTPSNRPDFKFIEKKIEPDRTPH
jgi:hypothetical protein